MSETILPNVPDVCISASRLKVVGGEKGSVGCERKYVGHYFFDLKQSSSPALEFGSALHSLAEDYQATNAIQYPESDVAVVFQSGAHLLATCGPMLVEHEHVGVLPDGTPYIAYLDGHTLIGHTTNCVVIADIKTTSNPRYALDMDPESKYYLGADIQAMFYAWILLCDVHLYCPPLGPDQFGPKHWRVWNPVVQGAHNARLRWLYFLTRGVARAWDVSVFVTPEQAIDYMGAKILPLVTKINGLHQWRRANPTATLNEIDRNTLACGGTGRWCGAGERDACDFSQLGTPINDLIQLKVRPKMTPQERLAALKNRSLANPLIVAAESAPAVVEAAPVVFVDVTPEPAVEVVQEAPKAKRGRPAKVVVPAVDAGINPPESAAALANLTAAPELAAAVATVVPAPAAPEFVTSADFEGMLFALTTEQLADLLVKKGYSVSLSRSQGA